jgi:predicted DNA-binding transcriptional regulator YafY
MSTTATRLITLIMLLQRRPNQKAAELADVLNVSVRTVQRYIAMLDEMGIPVYSDRGPHGGYSLVRGYRMPPLVLTPQEAVAIYLGTGLVQQMWGRLYEDAAQGALAKLDNVLPEEQRHEVAWAQRTLVATHMHRADQAPLVPVLEKLRRATRERRRVRMTYRSRGRPGSTERDASPYALVHRWGWWYAVAHCHLRGAVRTFRVDRVIELMLLDETFDVPAAFDVQEYLATEPYTRPDIEVQLRFGPEAALAARDDQAFWDTIAESDDGSTMVAFRVPSLEWAARQVLYYGAQVTVVEPAELARLVREEAQAIAALYPGSPGAEAGRAAHADPAASSSAPEGVGDAEVYGEGLGV